MLHSTLRFFAAAGLASTLAACTSSDAAPGHADSGPAATGGAPNTDAGSCTTTMFAKYGATAFMAVRDSIVTKALAAPTAMLGDTFQNFVSMNTPTQVDKFKTDLADFLVMVYGGPSNYAGVTMQEAHQGLGITSDQYDYFITQVVVPALSDNGVAMSDIMDCFAPPVTDPSFKASIVGQ